MQGNSLILKRSAMAVLFGAFIGAFVFLEPYLANSLAHKVERSIFGANIFKVFDFELTLLIPASLVFIVIMTKVLSSIYSVERTFVLLYLIGLQTIALIHVMRFDFSEIVIIFFGMVLFIRVLDPEREITLTTFDLLNLFFMTSLVLPAVNGNPLQIADYMLTGIKMFLVTMLLVNYLEDMEAIKFALKWFVIITLISALIAIAQAVIFIKTGASIIGFVKRSELRFLYEPTSFGPMLRVPAFFGTYKPLTFFLNAAILFLLNYLLYCRSVLREKVFIGAALGIMFGALFFTFSKDAFLALFVGGAISILVWRPRLIFHWIALTLLVFAVAEALGLVDKALVNMHDEFTWQEYRIRFLLAKDGILGFFYRHPWVGIGSRNAALYTAHFDGWPAHNSFILAADSGGVVGLAAYTALVVYTFKCLFNVLLIVPRGGDRWISMGLFTGFVSYAIMVQFHPFFMDRFLWLYMGLVKAVELKYKDSCRASSSDL